MSRSSQAESDPVVTGEIESRIAARGRITFAEFMDIALYLPSHGYYSRPVDVIGPDGDYYTSPYVHPLFGELIGEQLAEMWQAMGSPSSFRIVELGANKGVLGYDILQRIRARHSALFEALSYIIVENRPSPAGSVVNRDATGGLGGKISLLPADPFPAALGNISGCFVSNELVDALPVHLVTWENGEAREVYVTQLDGQFTEELGVLSSPAIKDYLDGYSIEGQDGAYVEINLAALDWMGQIAAALDWGFALAIDYGGLARDLYTAAKKHGTLMCYYKHTAVDNPYIRVGLQDITSHVNFSALVRTGEENGLECLGLTTQAEFLIGLGLGDYLPALAQSSSDIGAYERERKALMGLIDRSGLGGFRVLIQGKGVGSANLRGLSFRL